MYVCFRDDIIRRRDEEQTRTTKKSYMNKIEVKKPRKCHSYEAKPSRSTKRTRDEEQIQIKQMPHTKLQMQEQRRTGSALERSADHIWSV